MTRWCVVFGGHLGARFEILVEADGPDGAREQGQVRLSGALGHDEELTNEWTWLSTQELKLGFSGGPQ